MSLDSSATQSSNKEISFASGNEDIEIKPWIEDFLFVIVMIVV